MQVAAARALRHALVPNVHRGLATEVLIGVLAGYYGWTKSGARELADDQLLIKHKGSSDRGQLLFVGAHSWSNKMCVAGGEK